MERMAGIEPAPSVWTDDVPVATSAWVVLKRAAPQSKEYSIFPD